MASNIKIFLLVTILKSVTSDFGRHNIDFQQRFLERRMERQIKDERLMLLDKYILRNTETVDGILHYRNIEDSSNAKFKRMKAAIERDFRRLIAMKGMKYNYKRDMHWRTWRNVLSEEGVPEFVCYKCNNPIKVNSVAHQNCGMWTIEEGTPPCAFEFYSMINDQKFCGANYTQFKDINSSCPSIINFNELHPTCDNPIETTWRFSKMYGVSVNYDDVICAGKDFCEIFTRYEILPQQVIFRIVNSTNDVIYSRIMRPNNTNYVCVEDCGHLNSDTGKISKIDKPMKLDLLTARNKRDDNTLTEVNEQDSPLIGRMGRMPFLKKTSNTKEQTPKSLKSKIKKRHQTSLDYDRFVVPPENALTETATVSRCKQIKEEIKESFEEQYDEYGY